MHLCAIELDPVHIPSHFQKWYKLQQKFIINFHHQSKELVGAVSQCQFQEECGKIARLVLVDVGC